MHESTWCRFLFHNFSWAPAYYTLVVSYSFDLWLLFVSCIHAIATLGLLPALNQGITSRRTGEDGLCCSSCAIQTRLGLSSLLKERSEIPIVLLFFCVVGYLPNWGKWLRYIDSIRPFLVHSPIWNPPPPPPRSPISQFLQVNGYEIGCCYTQMC